MKNFYIFFIAFLISGLGFGQDSDTQVVTGAQPTTSSISSTVDTSGEAIDVFQFVITDQGSGDGFPTKITSIRIRKGSSTANWIDTIENITLTNNVDGAVSLNSVTINNTTIDITITSGDLDVPDGTSRTLTLSVYFKDTGDIVDSSTLAFFIDDNIGEITTDATNSSSVVIPNQIVSESFNIVVEATQLTFLTQPSDVGVGVAMSPVEVGFTDINKNIDLNPDGFGTIELFSGGTLALISEMTIITTNGVASFDAIYHLEEDMDIDLEAQVGFAPFGGNPNGLSPINSTTFDVGALTQTTYEFDSGWTILNGDPNGVSLSSDKIVVTSGNANITDNTIIYDITVEPGASLTVQSGNRLTVVDNLTLNSQSNSYSSFIFNGTPVTSAFGNPTVIGGSMFYNRFVNSQANGNDLISPPFDNQSLTTFFNANASLLFNNGLTNPTTYLFGPFNKSTGTYTNWNSNQTGNLAIATGYRAATISGATLQFTGNLRRDQVPVTLNYGGAIYKDWNLVGNPFPSYIDIFDFLSFVVDSGTDPDTRNIDLLTTGSGIYGYNALENNSYTVVTLANAGDSPQETFIAPGQGFLVPAKDNIVSFGGGQLIFDPSMRTTGSSDDFISNRNANTEFIFLKLKAYTATKTYGTQFYFNENASLEIDHGYDGRILGNPPSFALYSNAIPDESQLPLALQALNPSDLANTTIPLGVKSNAGQQITFSISESTLPSTVEVYLEDTLTNTFTLLNDGDYTITPNVNLNGTGRFYLRLGDTALSTKDTTLDDLQIYTDYNARTIVISGNLTEITNASVFDLEGRLVSKTKLTASSQTQSINMDSFSAGVYVIQLDNSTQSKTQKVIWR